jgi:hypothetical protein
MAQSIGLPVNRFINVTVTLAPTATPAANFDTLLIVGDSNVIDVLERIRTYNSLSAVAGDFTIDDPEYKAAVLFFDQSPQPHTLYIGRWASSATAGINVGGPLSAAQQVLSNWTSITDGSFHVVIDGVAHNVTGLDLSGITNLNGVASIITSALTGSATCLWNGVQFIISTTSTGPSSAVTYLTSAGTGTDLSNMLQMSSTTAESLIAGIAAETPLEAVIILDGARTYWYFMTWATTVTVTSNDYLAVAGFVEGSDNKHMQGVTTNDAAAIFSPDTTSIGALLRAAGYKRSAVQYSTTTPYAVTSLFARGCTVDFTGSNTAITFMWQIEPGVDPEFLGSTAADNLDLNNYNYLAEISVGKSIIVNGKTAGGFYIDEVWGTDWMANYIQTGLFNLLYDAPKIPQTDAGVIILTNNVETSLTQAVTNGLLAPGVWNSAGFGSIKQGDNLTKGYYVWAPTVADQALADRAARRSPLIQVAAKLAGAVHTVDVAITVNRALIGFITSGLAALFAGMMA